MHNKLAQDIIWSGLRIRLDKNYCKTRTRCRIKQQPYLEMECVTSIHCKLNIEKHVYMDKQALTC